jgi:hypothetical protein
LRRLGVDERDHDSIEKPEGHKALFTIVVAVVLERVCDSVEDARSIDKVQSVVGQVGPALGFAPRKANTRSVYTTTRFRKGCLTSKVTGACQRAAEGPPRDPRPRSPHG